MSDKGLAAALCRAQMKIAGVEKGARNDFHRYNYTSAEQMIAHCREALAAEGVAIFPVGQSVVERRIEYVEEGKNGTKNKTVPAILVCSYLVMGHGEQVALATEIPLVPEAGRPLDKARFAAATEALGYLLRDLLLVPRGEGISEREDAEPAPARPQAEAPPDPAAARKSLLAACNAIGIPEAALEAFLLDKMGKKLDDLTAQQAAAIEGRIVQKSVQEQIWALYAGPGGAE